MTTARTGTELPEFGPDINTFNRFGQRQEPRTPRESNPNAVAIRRSIEERLDAKRRRAQDSFYS